MDHYFNLVSNLPAGSAGQSNGFRSTDLWPDVDFDDDITDVVNGSADVSSNGETVSGQQHHRRVSNVKVTAQVCRSSVVRATSAGTVTPGVEGKTSTARLNGTSGLDESHRQKVSLNSVSTAKRQATMAQRKAIEECASWMTNEQNRHETCCYGNNKQAVDDALVEQRMRTAAVHEYRKEVDKATDGAKEDSLALSVEKTYDNLRAIADKRLCCLEKLSHVAQMEELFANLTQEFAEKATSLVDEAKCEVAVLPEVDSNVANSAQSCILAVRNNWAWIARLLKCSEVHLQHAADYHEFFHDIKEYEYWMPVDLRKTEELVSRASLKRNPHGEDASRILNELKTALAIFLHWQNKVDASFERSRKVHPVHHRTHKLDYPRPVTSLCNYKTNEISIQEGEEVTLLNNSKTQKWQIRNLRAQTWDVPAVILVIPGPDPLAVETATRLRLQFLAAWTNAVKRIGMSLVCFLLLVIREWTADEEKLLRALSDSEKKDLLALLDSVELTFSPYFSLYPPYVRLQTRAQHLRSILAQKPDPNFSGSDHGQLLVIQTAILEEILARYRDFWRNWVTFRIMVEISRHPEYLLTVEKWQDYNWLEMSEWLRKWQIGLEFDESDLMDSWNLEVEVTSESTTELTSQAEDEVYTIAAAKETAETAQLTTSEQEERQTFVITGVIDPRNGEEVSLDRAVELGIINQSNGTYYNPKTREAIPIPAAMNAGKIKVEFTTSKKSEEKRSDLGLITIKTQNFVFTMDDVKAVVVRIDSKPESQMSKEEAIKAGILDPKNGVYKNLHTKEEWTLAEAHVSGLLILESSVEAKASDADVTAKTFAVHAVVDVKQKKRLTFTEAVRNGLINPDSGAYFNNSTNEEIYVGDAIRRGFIKATIVHDPTKLDIRPENSMLLVNATMQNFRQKMMQPVKALSALKRAGGAASENGSSQSAANGSK